MRSISLTPEAIAQLEEWRQSDSKMLAKIVSLLAEIAKSLLKVRENQSH
jgi:Txe/YoeB family toxin of Txe-Axe toxin-antitoxin module